MNKTQNLKEITSLISLEYSPFGIASSIMLTWLMKTDGRISKEESKILNDFLGQFSLKSRRYLFERIIDEFDLPCIELASDILRRDVDEKGKRLVIDLFLGMIVADGYITYTEMYVIEYISDLFSISPDKLNDIFLEATGRSKVNPGNPSSAYWWKVKEGKSYDGHNKEKNKNNRSNRRNETTFDTRRQKALAILGLERGASQQEIKETFRLLTKIHHPDRFDRLGKEAKASANSTYIRIKDAYEYLMSA